MSKIPINRSQGRSVVVSTRGIVATEHPLASQAGATVLAQGGHAVDAAIAANAVMGVVCPMMCGIGGDLFAIVCERRRKAARRERQRMGARAADARVSREPACRRHAAERRPLDHRARCGRRLGAAPRAVRPHAARARARGGDRRSPTKDFPVAEITSEEWHNQEPFLRGDPEAAKTFLPGGRPPSVGAVFRNSDLAWTYRQIAASGGRRVLSRRDRAPARRGARAARLDDGRRRSVGVPRAVGRSDFDDLPRVGRLRAAAERRRHCRADDVEHHGGACRLRRGRVTTPAEALHVMIEAKKLAYADMQRYVADPAFSEVPVAAMLNKEYARERAAHDRSGAGRRRRVDGWPSCPFTPATRTYLSVVDRARQHGVAHSEQLRELRLGRRRRGHRVSAAESRRAVHARSHAIRTCSRRASGRCTRSFRRS